MSSIATYMQANTVHDPDPRFENIPEEYLNNNGGAINNQQREKKFRLNISQRLHWTSILAFISYLILLISFASPYWLSSYKFTDAAFKRLGLWDFCFEDYRHPSYQYDAKFSGCHWIYSSAYSSMRDWLQPGWFMFVQATMTIALCIDTIGLMAISILFMHFLIQYQLIIMCITMVCHMFTTMLIAFALITFYLRAFDKSWIMYPEFNHVDWAFFFGLVSMGGNGFATYLYYQEVRDLKRRMLKMKRLIVATNGRSITSGDMDSLDAVYATRSSDIYNRSLAQDGNQRSFQQQGNKENSLIYPHFTQV